MSVAVALAQAAEQLRVAGVPQPRREAASLLARVLEVDASWLIAHGGTPLPDVRRERFLELVRRRAAREPFAYVLGEREFFGLPFQVTPAVLIPRPETELLVEQALVWARSHLVERIWEVGVGSGCVTAALARQLPQARLWATDCSAEALDVAAENFRRLGVADRIILSSGDLLTAPGVPVEVDLMVSNPPYIATAELDTLAPEIVGWEPRCALDGGSDGLALIRRLLAAGRGRLAQRGALLLEVGAGQRQVVTDAARANGWAEPEWFCDLAGHARVVVLT